METEAFLPWLRTTESLAATRGEAKVPCGTCVGCCTSSYFIHIEPDEKAALAAIPKELLFKAPGLPKGHQLMGFDDKGHCPMFLQGKCTIYASRPRTCRQYDCRIFAATDLAPDADKPRIAEQVSQWRFAEPSPANRAATETTLRALRTAAQFIVLHGEALPAHLRPVNATQQALLALKVYPVFLKVDAAGDALDTLAPERVKQWMQAILQHLPSKA
jgi:uncharacterized protein